MKLAQKIAVGYIRARLNLLAVVSKKKAAEKAFEIFCTPFRKSKKKAPPVFEKAEKLSFTFNNYTIRGYRWSHPSSKKFLILHGFESSAYNFDRYVNPVIKKGYEVLAFDAPAHGKSSGKQINLPLYVDTIKEIYRLYGPVDAFMAHSFGGIAITLFLESLPHNKNVKLVLIAPATETITAIDSFFRFLQLNNEVRKEFDALIEKRGGVPVSHYSISRAMKKIKASVLWFHDEDDDITPLKDALQVKNDHHPNIEFVITKGFGHRRIYRENSVFKRITEFV
ncbi:MAG: alpha/beta fold hydrolase [Chitinophagaceae bacterium]|nr:alpha/beta fold hydrolase [Chitinophagaceae bacterium]